MHPTPTSVATRGGSLSRRRPGGATHARGLGKRAPRGGPLEPGHGWKAVRSVLYVGV
eukprot:CAMPEP_0179885372 /NCGR_PEP_ID=MMETSP0982-20121206/30241_1 /TAXON_ID=483367 /ORGANISM="non described non described, Strain CCMP 2436" /LENGTH=56 /DNA_ID=CAMNT_0021780939 /DNA_START=258 /DNA_END=428 /DNA_ORIENTATION=-